MNSIEKEIRTLESKIRHHQQLYYKARKPEISDKEFDLLFKKLQDLEKANPEFASVNSPTKVVGSDSDNEFHKYQHKVPVLSLENTYNFAELKDWIEKTGIENEYSVEWKIDGASIVLYYEKGELVNGVSRGSGGIGDDVTENIRTIRNIPLKLPEPVSIYARGEVYMTFTDFAEFNEEFGGKYANPRNLAAGSIKHKNSSQTAKRPLRIFTYDAYFPEPNKKIKYHSQILETMSDLGLPVSNEYKIISGKKIEKVISEFKKKKDKVDYPVDGLVIKLNDLALRDALGATSHSPRWARAFKFDALMKETRIVNIDYAVGRTGKITPRAKVEPVLLAGTTVTYATLHNQDFIDEMGIGIGAKVNVAKRGEIIPAVEEVIEPGNQGIFKLPEKCPACGTVLLKVDESVDFFCPNKKCPDREKNSLIFFCQRKQMDIEGLGEKQIENFYNAGFIRSIPDIYKLKSKRDELIQTAGLGEKSVDIILSGIEKSKEKDFKFVLPSIGLSEVGHKVTEILIENGFDDIDKIIEAASAANARENLEEIHGMGPRTAESIVRQFQDRETLKLIDELKKAGLKFQAVRRQKSSLTLFGGQSWCVTGSFENFQPRDKAMDLIVYYGGRKVTSISTKTTHLLAGENAGSKLEKARELGVLIVNEKEFLEILKKAKIKL
ncbi:MAG: NAD-dependent DNA ligase LigA [Leptospira sp.]|nr:NAD-dependent DNA ligase LigA [Leptospira sp.]